MLRISEKNRHCEKASSANEAILRQEALLAIALRLLRASQ